MRRLLSAAAALLAAVALTSGVTGQTRTEAAAEPAAAPTAVASDDGFYFPLAHPVRVMDTRLDGGPLATGETRRVDLSAMDDAGRPGDSPRTRGTVVVTVTVTDASGPGYLTLWNSSTPRPTFSQLNWVAGQTVSNLAMASTGGDDRLGVYVSSGPVDVVIDASGYFPYDALGGTTRTDYVPLPAPERVYDSRDGGTPLHRGEARGIGLGPSTDSDSNAKVMAAAVTVTTANEQGSGFVTAWDGMDDPPDTSSVNYTSGRPQAAAAIVPVACLETDAGPCGDLGMAFYNGAGASTDLVVDVTGYFVLDPGADYLQFAGRGSDRLGDSRTGPQNPPRLGPGGASPVGVPRAGTGAPATRAAAVNITAVDPTAPTYLSVATSGDAPDSSISDPQAGLVTPTLAMPALDQDGNSFVLFNAFGTVDTVVDLEGIYYQSPECGDCGALTRTAHLLAAARPHLIRSFSPHTGG